MRPKSAVLLILALGCGLVAAIGVNQVLAKRHTAPPSEAEETVSIFVALQDIGLGDPLSPEVLKLEPWPKSKVPVGALTELTEVESRRTRTKIYAGEPILEPKLLAKGESSGDATELIPRGFRVVAISVDSEKATGNLIRPGDRIDMLVHLAENAQRNIPTTSTRTVLQNIKVFAVDDQFHRDSDGETTLTGRTVSLLVTPQQAEVVTLAAELGEIRLVMRSADDDTNEASQGITPDQLLGMTARPEESEATPDEPPVIEPVIPTIPPAATGLLGLLNQQATEPAVEPAPAAEPGNAFRMVLLVGTEVKQIEIPEGGLPVETTGAVPPSALPTPGVTPITTPDAGGADVGGVEEPTAALDDPATRLSLPEE